MRAILYVVEELARVAVVCAIRGGPLALLLDEEAARRDSVELVTTSREALLREVSRASMSGGGVVAVACSLDEVQSFRAAGADEVVIAGSHSTNLGASVARAVHEARQRSIWRNQRVDHLMGLLGAVQQGTAKPDALLAGIALELLERPMQVVSASNLWPSSAGERYRNPEAIAALRESFYVIHRVHELQASVRRAAQAELADLEAVARHLAPMLGLAFGNDISVRVVPRCGPYRSPIGYCRAAAVILAAAVALACSSAEGRESVDEEGSPERDGFGDILVHRPSGSFHLAGSPAPGRAAVTVGLLSMGDLIRLWVATDLADPEALPFGVVDPKADVPPRNIAHAALLLAAACVAPWKGFVDVSATDEVGAEVNVFLPGDGPPMDGWQAPPVP